MGSRQLGKRGMYPRFRLVKAESMVIDLVIFGRHDDEHVISISNIMSKRNLSYVIISTQDMLSKTGKFLYERSNSVLRLTVDNKLIDLDTVRAFWSRRLSAEIPMSYNLADATQSWLESEHLHGLIGIVASIYDHTKNTSKWVNSPIADYIAELKIYQLQIASRYIDAWSIPSSIVSNSSIMFSDFVNRNHNSRLITKALHKGFYRKDGTYELFYTTEVTDLISSPEYLQVIDQSCNLIQKYIEKKYEVRVTIIDKEFYCVAIYSQQSRIANIDWRHYDLENTPHELIDIPLRVKNACLAYMRDLNLVYGAIDFIVDQDDNYHFLEINPKGQWLWLEDLTNIPISLALANYFSK